jgi:DNA segregation ATPase FtsK/SpoIIIE-like protein
MTFVAETHPATLHTPRDTDFTAALLQMALSQHKLEAIVTPLFDGPQVETYQVALSVGGQPERVERLSGALAMAAGVAACRVARAEGRLLVEIPKPKQARKTLLARRFTGVQRPTPLHVPLGVGTTGLLVWYDQADERMCHLVLGGTTRSGKTNALHWLLACLLKQNPLGRLRLLLADPKRGELTAFALSRHLLHPVMHDLTEIVKALLWLQETMTQRAAEGTVQPRILMVIDEVRQLVRRERRVQHLLSSIAEMGAGVGIHLVVATQQPGAKALGEALANFPARLLGRVASATLTYGAAGRARSQAETLLGRGDMLLIAEGGVMHRVQVPLMSKTELADIPHWKHTGQIPCLSLPEAVNWGAPVGVDTRGGWNRKKLDMDAVIEMIEEGATAAQISHRLNINYARAQRLVAQLGREDEDE